MIPIRNILTNSFYAGLGGSLPDDGPVRYGLYVSSYGNIIELCPTRKWEEARRINLQGYKIRGVKIWFSPGCRSRVNIKMHYNGKAWLPENINNYSDYYTGDDVLFYIKVNKVIDWNDYVEIFFQNLDTICHVVDVKFEMIGEREWENKSPEDEFIQNGGGNLRNVEIN